MNTTWPEARQNDNFRTRAAMRLMAVISVCHLLLPILQLGLFLMTPGPGGAHHDQAITASATISMVFAISGLLIFIASYFFYFLWVYQAHKNLALIGLENLQYRPDWAVGWYFIPVGNFLKPFHAMRELWRATNAECFIQGPSAWQSAPVSMQVNVWWALWLVSWLVDQLTANVELTHQGFVGAFAQLLLSALLSAGACFATLRLVQAVHARQARLWGRLLSTDTAAIPAWMKVPPNTPPIPPEPVDTDDPL